MRSSVNNGDVRDGDRRDGDRTLCGVCCETVEQWIGEQWIGESDLRAELPEWVRRHLASCLECGRESEFSASAAKRAMTRSRFDRAEPSTDRFFTRRVMASVRAEPAPVVRLYGRLRRRAAVALVVGGLVAAAAMSGGPGVATFVKSGQSGGGDQSGGVASDGVVSETLDAGRALAVDSVRPMMQQLDPPLAAGFIPVEESDGTKFSM